MLGFFFFEQMTAYDLRISDWSSDVCSSDLIVKGYEMSKGNYVLLDEEEIEAVKLESKRTLELLQFVDAGDIDILYYAKPYYVVPADELAEEAYIVLREALKRTKKVGLGDRKSVV